MISGSTAASSSSV
uniref:Uncharacterized protein n=1 Tax=Rhizophora mucronata TaxID=61149 RepID=A0A2P2PAB8_RHIMU